MLIGHLESQKWGAPSSIRLLPDIWEYGQTPQMMQLVTLPAAALGAG